MKVGGQEQGLDANKRAAHALAAGAASCKRMQAN